MNIGTAGKSLPLATQPMSEPVSHWEPGDPLPKPTRSQEQAIADLKEFGYTIIEDALDADQTAGVRDRLTTQADAVIEAGIAFEDQGVNQNRTKQYDRLAQDTFTAANGGINQRVWMLINKGQVFRDLGLPGTARRASPWPWRWRTACRFGRLLGPRGPRFRR